MQQPQDIEKYRRHYSEPNLARKLGRAARKAGIKLVYLVLLLYYVLKSPNVSTADKGKIYGALGYFILPIDLIPDFIPMAGYTDDLAALIWATHAVIKNITPEVKRKAKDKLYDWFGEYDKSEIIIDRLDPDICDDSVDEQG